MGGTMTDFASLGIQLDSRPVVEGTKALDALGEASARVEQKVRVSNGQMSDTAKIMQAQADQAKAAAQANAVLGNSTSALTLGQAQLIERFREQAATVGMSRSQLMAYQAAQLGVTEQTRESIAIIKAQEDAIKAAAQAKADAAKKSNFLTDALKLLAGAYAALKVADYVKDSALMSARYETLGVVLATVGKTAGYTSTQMEHASQEIAAQGITMLESRNSAIKLVQAHVDLVNASKLARIAQDAAVIGNINSSEAFERLVNGVSRGNVLILRNIGINVNLQNAYAQMADSLGKSTKELTENERVQARLGAVMERGTDIAGTYEAAMGTAGKQILSMQRYVDDLKVKFGETFNEVLTVGVMALTNGLKDANGEVSDLAKNNQLEAWGHGITKIFVEISDAVGNTVTTMEKVAAFAAHREAQAAIEDKYKAQAKEANKSRGFFDIGPTPGIDRIHAARDAELAQENADYAAQQAALSAQFGRFGKAYDEFYAQRLEKKKADAAAKLKVDQDYAKAATDILMNAAGKGAAAQEAARQAVNKLYAQTYVGTPTYRDTEGRDPKPKVDQADNTALQDHLARIQQSEAIDKQYFDFAMKLDDMRHKAGEISDADYYAKRRENMDGLSKAELSMYDRQLAALRAHHNSTKEEEAKTAKAINDILDNRKAAETKALNDGYLSEEEERLRQKAAAQASEDATNKYTSDLQRQLEAIDAAASRRLADMAIRDWQRAGSSIADSLSNAFGTGGKAIGQMYKAFAEGQSAQLRAQKELAVAKKLSDDNPEKLRAIQQAQLAGTQAQLKSYGDMADAAQGFFDQGSKGYAAMHAAAQVLHGAEVALSLVKGVNAVLTQGEGDPYSAFARMAAMAALVTGLGVALSGGQGGADTTAADRQAAQGTGTVLGDGKAKSESISRAIELSASNSSTQIDYLQGMLMSLRSIESGISRFAAQVVGTTDLSGSVGPLDGGNATRLIPTISMISDVIFMGGLGTVIDKLTGGYLDKLTSKLGNAIFGGKQKLDDSGFTIAKASLASILASGAQGMSYADITTSGGWFSSDDHDTKTTSLGTEANAQFSLVIESLADSITEAGKLLGVSGASFEAQLDSFVVDIGKISLKGMTGDEIQKALESVFSKLGDQMASYAVGGLQQFQRVGEGYLETLVRVASDYAKVDASLQSIGKTFGATGIASIKAREDLIALMGGIDEFQSQTAGFASNYLTKAEQLAPVAKYVDEQLASMGLAGITTRDQFKQVALCLDLTTAAGQKQYAAMMDLQEAFAATHAAIVDLSKTEQEIADEKKDLQDQLDQLTMTQTQLAQKARYALAEVNRPLYDLVQTAQKLADTATNMEKFRDAAKSLNDSLVTGALTTLNPVQQEAELQAQYEKIKAAAMAGDTKAQDQFSSALTAWLTASQKLNSGDTQYQADFAQAQQDTAAAAAWASAQVDTAQAQLNAMNSQTDALQSANGMLAAANTILQTIAQNTAPAPIQSGYVLSNAISTMGTVLGTAIKAVQAEVASLRKDQDAQTGNAIAANAEGQQAIVDSVNKGAQKTTTIVEKVTLE